MDKYFIEMLRNALQPELGRANVNVFVDRHNLKEGGRWPQDLCDQLTHSRILLPLFCAGYWNSDWCKKELAIMLQREARCGVRDKPGQGLIVPIIIHDGDLRPTLVTEIQSFQADRRHVACHLPSKAGLERFVTGVAVRIAEHIQNCPPFEERFKDFDGGEFLGHLSPPPFNGGFPSL